MNNSLSEVSFSRTLKGRVAGNDGRHQLINLTGEFDSGSERTLAACLTHASLTGRSNTVSGARVSNAWVICPQDGDNLPKGGLIPNKTTESVDSEVKGGLYL